MQINEQEIRYQLRITLSPKAPDLGAFGVFSPLNIAGEDEAFGKRVIIDEEITSEGLDVEIATGGLRHLVVIELFSPNSSLGVIVR